MIEQPKKYTNDEGNKIWYLPSKGRDYLHRLDGPAVEDVDGIKEWWVDGKFHRLDGPAIEWENGTKQWWVDDKLYRLGGPAVEYASGTKEWWIDGRQMPTKEVETWLEENNIDLTTEEGQMALKLRWA